MSSIKGYQIRRIYGLLPNMVKHDADLKGNLVESFTEDCTKRSVKDLTYNQAVSLIKHLEAPVQSQPKADDRANVMRRKIIAICHELGFQLPGSKKIDMKRVNSMVAKIGHKKADGHKTLNDYKKSELPTLITQFERVLNSHLKQ